jgi:tellurite resistance protein TerC
VFALMGLRQLYFLLGDLLRRLVYLSLGLSVILAFIGVKLVLHAMHQNELPFINGGHHISWAPEIPIWVSLAVIILTLGITTLASLRKSRIDAAAADDEPGTPAVETNENAETNDEAEADENSERNKAARAGGGELDEATVAEIEKIETQPSAKPFKK